MKHKNLKLWTKILLLFVIVFCFATSAFLLYLNINFNKNKNNKLLYSYNINQNINYKVNLFDNSFIDDTTLESNEMYISELVKNIDLNYTFDYSATKEANLKYKYKVIGTISGTYQGNNLTDQNGSVWNKDYVLLDEVEKEINKSNFYINQKILLDFPTYKKEVESFKKNFSMILTTKMDIKFIVNVTGTIDDEIIDDEKIINLSFPLGVQAFSITEEYEKTINKNINITREEKLFVLANPIFIVVIFLTGLVITLVFFKRIFIIKEKNEYTKKLEKILKTYNDIIIEIASPVNIDDYEIIEVKGIEEMVDLEEELRIPINFYEHIPNYYGEFTLIHNNLVYRYIIEEKNKDI